MAQNLTLWNGATYSDVPSVQLPKQGGGLATFTDVSDTTAVAADVADTTYFYTAAGVRTKGTNSGGGGVTLQTKTKTYTPTTSQQTDIITADAGYDGLEEVDVTVSAMPAMTLPTSASGSATGTRKATISASTSTQYINIPTGYNSANAYYQLSAMPSGSAGTPTATKGTVSGHAVTVTPSVTNTTGYITGETKTGTGVSVSASELVSGSETKTENGTYDVTNLASLVVNVSGGTSKNVQIVQGTTRTSSSSMTVIGAELTVSKTGTYDIYWSGVRSTTSGSYTYATQLYISGTAYGSENATWTNNVQNNHLTNVSLTANQTLRVRGRNSRNSSYYIYAPTLVIIET